jgi:transposase
MQADAFSGFGRLYKPGRALGPIVEAACWSHARRGFFELAELQKAPIAVEAVQRIGALFAIEREINGLSAGQRLAVRQDRSRPLVADFEAWMRAGRAKLSRHSEAAKAIDYMLNRLPAFTRFLDDGTMCLATDGADKMFSSCLAGCRSAGVLHPGGDHPLVRSFGAFDVVHL